MDGVDLNRPKKWILHFKSRIQVLVNVSELMLGMYVCELDKPWKEAPFIFQGFIIQNQEVLQQVKDECVYID